jgi:hypothetical protein
VVKTRESEGESASKQAELEEDGVVHKSMDMAMVVVFRLYRAKDRGVRDNQRSTTTTTATMTRSERERSRKEKQGSVQRGAVCSR